MGDSTSSFARALAVTATALLGLFVVACDDSGPRIQDAAVDTPMGVDGNGGDRDGDGIPDSADNCPDDVNADQANADGDPQGDACDPDDDNDTVLDAADNCPTTANTDQANADGDPQGDACDPDDDNDTVADAADNCPTDANTDQANHDTDPMGDACDPDDDDDTLADSADNCPTVTNPGQEDTDSRPDPVAVAGTYNPRPAPTTVAVSGDDAVSAPLDLGFTFTFFGQPFTQINVSTNGFITFGDTASGCCSGQALPDAAAPNGVIAAFWEDLNTGSGGTITWGVTGTAPDREAVISWNAVAHYGGGNPVTAQIILHETTNVIEVQCTSCPSDGGNHTQGIESPDGMVGVALPGRTAANFSATSDAVQFLPAQVTPDGVGDACDVCPAVFDPAQADADGDGHGDACDVCPMAADPTQADGDADGAGDACDNCPAVANPTQADFNHDGMGDACQDTDSDTVLDDVDNCPATANTDQADSDGIEGPGDGVGDVCDNCPADLNADQADQNGNGVGDVCEDSDGDGAYDATDNCPNVANADQADGDGDGRGDVCDNCPTVANPTQADTNSNGTGDACEDRDGDGVFDSADNCPDLANPTQANQDGDALGDVCDPDVDGDGVANTTDNCPLVANPNQADANSNGVGDACDDSDGDGVLDLVDNCRTVANPDQRDGDGAEGGGDGVGTACDNCALVANPDQADADHNGVGDACEGQTCATPVADGCVATETCGNGTDDNCNGQIDEGCACTPGAVQSCFRGPPGRRDVGACIDGSQTCSTTGTWGACSGGLSPSTEACDGLDNNCNGCVDDAPGCGTVALACPDSGNLPEGSPFVDYVIDGSAFFGGAVQAWSWEVTGGPCDQLFATTTGMPAVQSFTLAGQTTSTLTIHPTLSGDYTVRVRITAVGGQVYVCTFIIHISNPGLRVELCSDRSGATDLDLHVHRPGTTTNWFSGTDDCNYITCKAGSGTVANWGYANSPLAECSGGPEGSAWTSLGYCRNPRLDIDSISNNGRPENINVDVPNDGETFRVMVNYYGGSGVTHPMVNVYCGGNLRGTYGAPGNQLTNFDSSGGQSGDMWRVVDATTMVIGGVTVDCNLTPLHPPGMSTGYWVDNSLAY